MLARAMLAEQAGDYGRADDLLQKAIDAERAIGDQPGLIEGLTIRGMFAVDHRERELAAAALSEALEIAVLYGSKMRLLPVLDALASFVHETDARACVRLAAAAEQLRKSLGAAPLPSEQARLGSYLATAKRRLGDTTYLQVWAGAQGQPLEALVNEARQFSRVLRVASQGARSRLRTHFRVGRWRSRR